MKRLPLKLRWKFKWRKWKKKRRRLRGIDNKQLLEAQPKTPQMMREGLR